MTLSPLSDYQGLKSDALASLREVAELADSTGATSLAERLESDRIPRLEQERFHLVVLGEFNHGKTTFVNALLGAPVLPVGVTPTTAVIHHVVHGVAPHATAHGGGDSHDVPVEEVADYVVGGKAAEEKVQYLEIDYPASILEGGVVLVDTPGVNDLNSARAEITYSYLPKADAILFLLDAGQILKESERAFIANKLLAQSRDKVMFVINKIDLLDDGEREEALAYARTHLAKLVPEPKVFALSAEQALGGEVDASGLGHLLAELRTFLTEERGRVLIDNALDAGLRAAATLDQSLKVQRRALEMDQDELERRLAALEADLSGSEEMADRRERQVRESLAGVKALVRRETEEFGKRFALALPGEIEASKAEDLKRYLPSFMEERFRSFADQQGEELAKRLEKVAEEAITFVTEDANEQRKKLEELLGGASGPDVDLSVNTLAYDVGVIALGAFGIGIMALSNIFVGGAMTLAAPVLAYFFRGRADREMKKRALEEAPEAVREAARKLAEAFEKQIDGFGDKLVEFVRTANEETTRSIAEVVRAARSARAAGAEDLEELTTTVSTSVGRLKAVTERMTAARRSLWTNGASEIAAGASTPAVTPEDEAAATTTTADEDAVAADLDDDPTPED
ncbi:MAG: dynamin family protein [Sandaracinaceae bacterium]|nr:dynamin family protein [Sandaracinaceae bacterium]